MNKTDLSPSQPASPRVVIITHSSSSVGPALAVKLILAGHNVFLHNPTASLLESLAGFGPGSIKFDRINSDGALQPIRCEDDANGLVGACLEAFGQVDSMLLRATEFLMGDFEDIAVGEYERVRGNLDACFYLLRAVLPVIRKPGGSVVMTTSAHGVSPGASYSVYAAVRAAENALAKALAAEYAGSGIAINAIATNYMKFPGFMGGWKDEYEKLAQGIPRGQFGSMEELAEFCQFLLENRSPHLLGQVISFSGGWN